MIINELICISGLIKSAHGTEIASTDADADADVQNDTQKTDVNLIDSRSREEGTSYNIMA